MKTLSILNYVASAFVVAAAASSASAGPATIAVSAPPTLAAWSKRVFRDMEGQLTYPTPSFRDANAGIVAVKFNCSDSGAPASVSLLKSSRHRELDAAALRAVQRIATLHPLPAGMMHGQQFVVRVLFATSPESARDQIEQMQKDAARSNAWFGKNSSTVAALEIAPYGG